MTSFISNLFITRTYSVQDCISYDLVYWYRHMKFYIDYIWQIFHSRHLQVKLAHTHTRRFTEHVTQYKESIESNVCSFIICFECNLDLIICSSFIRSAILLTGNSLFQLTKMKKLWQTGNYNLQENTFYDTVLLLIM